MGKSVLDAREYVRNQLQQKLGQLSKELGELKDKKTTALREAATYEINATSKREAAKILDSQIIEKELDIQAFRDELRVQNRTP